MDGDEIVRVGDVPVKGYPELSAQLAQQPEKALEVTVRRAQKIDDKSSADKRAESQELTFEVPSQQLHRFNFSMRMGPITSVRAGSPAATAGITAGDVIELVDGKRLGDGPTPTETWDGETLSDYLRRAAAADRDVELTLQRTSDAGRKK